MTKGIFVTATGTDVGKTYISGLLVKKMTESGLNCGYYKPVLSGLKKVKEEYIAGDCKFVIDTAGLNTNPSDCVTYSFKNPVSPHLAAKMEGVNISEERIKDGLNKIKAKYDYLVVEGAGGITCPFNLDGKKLLLSDVIKKLNMDIIIVTPSGLGCINYALLTYEYAKINNVTVKGFIMNDFDENNFMHTDNKECIEKLTGAKVIATVRYGDKDLSIDKDTLTAIFGEI